MEFELETYLAWFTEDQWSIPTTRNWSLGEYATQRPKELTQSSNLRIMSTYHTLVGKSVIIDGCNRAVALATLVRRNQFDAGPLGPGGALGDIFG